MLGVRDRIPRIGERIVNLVVCKIFRFKDIFCGLKGYRVEKIAPDFELTDSVGTRLALTFIKKKMKESTWFRSMFSCVMAKAGSEEMILKRILNFKSLKVCVLILF